MRGQLQRQGAMRTAAAPRSYLPQQTAPPVAASQLRGASF